MRASRLENRDRYLEIEQTSRTKAKKRLGTTGWKRRSKAYNLKKYGLTLEEFEAMAAAQDGQCAICDIIPETTLQVDHDHTTGKVRGLLCHTCNQGMVAVDRVDDFAEKAKGYLQRRN